MYGVRLGTIKIGQYKIMLTDKHEYNEYIKKYNDRIEKSVVVEKGIKIETRPIYPLYYPKYITQFMLCKLNNIIIRPNSEIKFKALMPIDMAIYAIYNSNFNIIDIIPLHNTYKLVLYGSQQSGIVARYCSLEISDNIKEGYVIVPISVRNETRHMRIVSNILLDASPLKIYYKKNTWIARTQEIELSIMSSSTAIILYGKEPKEGFLQLEDPPELKPPRLINRTEMIWGY